VSIIGETFEDVPDIFYEAKNKLISNIINYGYVQTKDDYYRILAKSDIIISTSNHEFFGVSV
jgi:glycerol-3-phosphate responsive antiterminator